MRDVVYTFKANVIKDARLIERLDALPDGTRSETIRTALYAYFDGEARPADIIARIDAIETRLVGRLANLRIVQGGAADDEPPEAIDALDDLGI
jgi:hypothetical protein